MLSMAHGPMAFGAVRAIIKEAIRLDAGPLWRN